MSFTYAYAGELSAEINNAWCRRRQLKGIDSSWLESSGKNK